MHPLFLKVTSPLVPLFIACLVEKRLTVATGTCGTLLSIYSDTLVLMVVLTCGSTSLWPTAAHWCPISKLTIVPGSAILQFVQDVHAGAACLVCTCEMPRCA